ncbi:hypothetical protein ABW21_db0204915 [Orbilia brochopaga]|nr:hypothetical protein ABW21_db0204915 [Drechslerella brochopaga]
MKILNEITVYSVWRASLRLSDRLPCPEKKGWLLDLEQSGYKRIGSLLHLGMPKTADALASAILSKMWKTRQTNCHIIKSVKRMTWAIIDNLVHRRKEAHLKAAEGSVIDCTNQDSKRRWLVDEEGHIERFKPFNKLSFLVASSPAKPEEENKVEHASDIQENADTTKNMSIGTQNVMLKRPRGRRTPGNGLDEAQDRQNSSAMLLFDSDEAGSDNEAKNRPSKRNKCIDQENTNRVLPSSHEGTEQMSRTMEKTNNPSSLGDKSQISSLQKISQDPKAVSTELEARRGNINTCSLEPANQLTGTPDSLLERSTPRNKIIRVQKFYSLASGKTSDKAVQTTETPMTLNQEAKVTTRDVLVGQTHTSSTRKRTIGTQTTPNLMANHPVFIPRWALTELVTGHETLKNQARKNTEFCERIEKTLSQLPTIETKLSQLAVMETRIQNMQEILVNLLEFCKGRDISN